MSFDTHMWDRLVHINSYNKRALSKLKHFRDFTHSLTKQAKAFTGGLRKAAMQLQTDFRDPEYESTLNVAIVALTEGLVGLARTVELSLVEID